MRIRMLTARVEGNGRTQQWGDVIEVSNDEALRMIAAGQAVRVGPEHETAMVGGGAENAMRPAGRARTR